MHSQSVNKDSIADALKSQIKQAKSDTLQINLKLDLAGRMAIFNLDTAVVIVRDVEKHLEKIDKNSAFYKKTKFTILKSFANVEIIKENLANALEYQLQAVDYSIKTKDSINLGISYRGLGNIYQKLRDLPNAENYYRLALNIQEKQSTPEELSTTHHKLGYIFIMTSQLDSALVMFEKAKKIHPTKQNILSAESNIATVYKAQMQYDKALEINKKLVALTDPKDYSRKGVAHENLASTYGFLEDREEALKAVDSSIYYYKLAERKIRLMRCYNFKANILHQLENYKEAYKYQALYKVYSDSVNDVEEHKRITELKLNHKFDKEREVTALAIKNESAKKQLYFILFFIAIIAGLATLFLVRKNSKQRLQLTKNELELKKVEQLKSDLALAHRENELKKVVIESSITEEVLNKTLDDINEIITFDNEHKRRTALKSVSASLLSKKGAETTTAKLQTYLEDVDIDFKIKLDTHTAKLNSREKELLCLMKLGLGTNEISTLKNTTPETIKSLRYRIRKKMKLNPNEDIIDVISSKMS